MVQDCCVNCIKCMHENHIVNEGFGFFFELVVLSEGFEGVIIVAMFFLKQ